ncbi:hypothetical protein CO045_02215 [Candidatus Peregrinibacteria bacterium CG_4_9_14_0_2_um_filter_41_14]|nr:MAG: hypothetical protein COY06_03145 [Candidatus Peregrinibacteria bacterium CG_4_10_14_0_2_um_filter_41_8]PJC38068.1 MAG: hypothetical protein CO045_02215 [Candidatus Peregrinibacteria bacterium CG_4_9_14_0_2_um_filter_41_14]
MVNILGEEDQEPIAQGLGTAAEVDQTLVPDTQHWTFAKLAQVIEAFRAMGRHLGINSVPNSFENGGVEDKQRRLFLQVAAVMVTAGIFMPGEVFAQDNDKEHEENNEHSDLDPILDISTAGLVLGNFVRNVIWRGAIKGHDLGPKSAIEMNLLAIARIWALNEWGGKEGEELAAEELHEIKGGLLPLPLLVLLSDITTTELKVDPERIFAAAEEAVANDNSVDYKNTPNRPDLASELVDWQKYLEVINADLANQVGKVAAITTVLGPIGTTYSSSALANNMKEDVLHILYEQSFALAITEAKASNTELDEPKLQQQAIARAEKMFNGPRGYSSLMLTLSANIQGAFAIGDPPEIYFALNHASSNHKEFAEAHALGLAISEAYTSALTSGWLLSTGINPLKAGSAFISGQYKTLEALAQSLAKKDLRSVSLNGGKEYLDKVMKAANTIEDPEGKLTAVLRNIPKAKLQLNLADYAANKADALKRNKFIRRLIAIQQKIISDPETFGKSHLFEELYGAFIRQDQRELEVLLTSVENSLQTGVAQELATIFKAIIDDHEFTPQDKDENTDHEELPSEIDPELAGRVNEAQSASAQIIERLTSFSSEEQSSRFEQALKLLQAGPNQGENVYAALASVDEKTAAQAIKILTDLEEREDVVAGLDDEAHAGDKAADFADHHDVPHFLSHSAKEVLFALLTQIPSVPAIARLAKLTIPQLAFIEDPEKLTPAELKRIIAIMLPIEAAMSGVADNVAAYLFAENVICSFFERAFGPKVYEVMPALKVRIGTITVKIAEVAGSLTKVGNGPNFSQEKCQLLIDPSSPQGVSVDRVQLPMGETLPNNNHFAAIANVTAVMGGIGYLHSLVDEVAETMAA